MNAAGAHVHAPLLFTCHVLAGIRWLASSHSHVAFPRCRVSPHPPGGIRGTRAHLPVSLPRGGGSTTEPTCFLLSHHNLPPHCRPSDQRRMWVLTCGKFL